MCKRVIGTAHTCGIEVRLPFPKKRQLDSCDTDGRQVCIQYNLFPGSQVTGCSRVWCLFGAKEGSGSEATGGIEATERVQNVEGLSLRIEYEFGSVPFYWC